MTALTVKLFSPDLFYRLGYIGLDFLGRILSSLLVDFIDNPVKAAPPFITRNDLYFNPFMIFHVHVLEGLKNTVFINSVYYLRHVYYLLALNVFILTKRTVEVNEQNDSSSTSDGTFDTIGPVTPSINGLYLTWTTSPNDPGCVTGYEVVRATSSGGVYSNLTTVEKGVVKYNDTSASAGTTYYYKVRAVAGTEYSPYTAVVSGKR